jgi:hypothetical protein
MPAGSGCKLGRCGGWNGNSRLTPPYQNNAGSRVCAAPKSDQCAGKRGNRRSLHCAPPHFLLKLVGSASFMRLSSRKAAHAALSTAAQQEIRVRFGRDDKGCVGSAPGGLWAGNRNCRSLAESCLDQSRRDGGGASLASSAINSPGWLTRSSSSGSMCTRTSATLATCCRT